MKALLRNQFVPQILIVVLGGIGLWAVYHYAIAARYELHGQIAAQCATMRESIEKGQAEVELALTLEKEAAEARRELHRMGLDTPAEEAMVGVPTRVQAHFRRFGFAEPSVRMNSAIKDRKFPRYERIVWGVGLPMQHDSKDISRLLLAVAELQDAERNVHVSDVSIHEDGVHPGRQIATVTLSLLTLRTGRRAGGE
jgi:hypothetical protein